MPGRVFVTGGGGFVGSAVIEELLGREYAVTALAHRAKVGAGGNRVRTVEGGLFDAKAVDAGVAGCDAVLHLVGIIFEKPGKGITFDRIHVEGTKRVVGAARRAGVRRYVHMSSLGSRPDAKSRYHQTKHQAEEYVRASGLDWTIFRPSLIHGPKGEFLTMEAGWARGRKPPFFFMPYFGGGAFGQRGAGLIQPVYVKDVARAFVDALEKPQTIGEVYPLGGPDTMSWPQMHRTAAEILTGRKRRLTAPLPAWLAKVATYVAPQSLLEFNRDQVQMSQEDNTCDLAKFRDDFGWDPRPFRATLEGYAKDV